MATKPWQHSTGPKTPAGRNRSVINGKVRQKGEYSVREARAQVKATRELLRSILVDPMPGVFDM